MDDKSKGIIERFEGFGKQLCGDKHGWKKAYAEKLGTDGQHINKILNGSVGIGGKLQDRLRDMGADVDYILTGRHAEPPPGQTVIQFGMTGYLSKEDAAKFKTLAEKLNEVKKDDPDAVDKIIDMVDIMFRKK